MIHDTSGSLYGTTRYGGGSSNCQYGCGTVFKLQPTPTRPLTPLTPWVETVLYRFQGGTDGSCPGYGDLVFDQSGAAYNTFSEGGGPCTTGHGGVYALNPSGHGYTQSVIYRFAGGADGAYPFGSVLFDGVGNLYTTAAGTTGVPSTVIKLAPQGGGWSETTLHQFSAGSDGWYPVTGLILDSSGNLYGTTLQYGPGGGGTAFEMMPSGGSWTYKVLQGFSGGNDGPGGVLLMDAAGNLYGTTVSDGPYGWGNVFELSPSNGGWTYKDLHDFTGGSDGDDPQCNLIMDANGNLYGTATYGGQQGANCRAGYGCGVVFEITP